jgi:hypothetical protein
MLGWLATAQAQQSVLEVIDLKYRSAEQIVPMLKPLRRAAPSAPCRTD